MFQASVSHHQECANLPVCQPAPLSPTFRTIQVTRDMLLEVHGYLVKYLLYGQIVEFFIIHICIWPDTILLSTYRLSVSAIWLILLSGIIYMRLTGRFYYPYIPTCDATLEFHGTCHSVTFYIMKKDSKRCCDTMTPESIHTKDESKRGSAFAFIFGVN